MKTSHPSERGQALVLIVLAIVGLMGFSALAIDGGMLYSERRRAQNAADTAAFAAAMAGLNNSTETQIISTGKKQAEINGFDDKGTNTVIVSHPPSSDYAAMIPANYIGDSQYYLVIIRAEFTPFFAHFVYSGKMENTVWAIAKAKGSTNPASGNAVFTTGEKECHGVDFSNSKLVKIVGGNVYSHSEKPADTNCASIKDQGHAPVEIINGGLKAVGGVLGQEDITVHEPFKKEQGVTAQTLPDIDPPDCTGYTVYNLGKNLGTSTLSPGIYANGLDLGNGTITLQPGLYCLDGDLTASANTVLTGKNVMIYMRGSAGNPSSIKINGGAHVELESPTGTPLYDAAGEPWSGMAIYMDYENPGTILFNGNGFIKLWGTVYAPGPPEGEKEQTQDPKCIFTGSSGSINMRTQIICWSVTLSGATNTEIYYDEKELFHERPMVELSQ